jgi:hypothetical protein
VCGLSFVPLDTGPDYISGGGKPGQKIAIAAAEIEYPATGLDHGGNDPQVKTDPFRFRRYH